MLCVIKIQQLQSLTFTIHTFSLPFIHGRLCNFSCSWFFFLMTWLYVSYPGKNASNAIDDTYVKRPWSHSPMVFVIMLSNFHDTLLFVSVNEDGKKKLNQRVTKLKYRVINVFNLVTLVWTKVAFIPQHKNMVDVW